MKDGCVVLNLKLNLPVTKYLSCCGIRAKDRFCHGSKPSSGGKANLPQWSHVFISFKKLTGFYLYLVSMQCTWQVLIMLKMEYKGFCFSACICKTCLPIQIRAGTEDREIQKETQERTTSRLEGTYVSRMKYRMLLLSSKWKTSLG